jgi:hypothetical protein
MNAKLENVFYVLMANLNEAYESLQQQPNPSATTRNMLDAAFQPLHQPTENKKAVGQLMGIQHAMTLPIYYDQRGLHAANPFTQEMMWIPRGRQTVELKIGGNDIEFRVVPFSV